MSSRISRRVLAVAFVAASAATWGHAQQVTVHGSVTDEKGEPLSAVRIILEPAGGDGARVATETKRKGAFFFGVVRPGVYRLKAELAGKVLVAVRAHAVDPQQKEAWKIEGNVRPDQPPTLQLDDGFAATVDLILEDAAQAQAADSAAAAASADQAIGAVIQKIRSGDCAGALPQIDEVLKQVPTNARAHYLRGFCLGTLDRDAEAVVALARTLELNPKFEGAALLAGQLSRRQGKLPDAEASFKRELESSKTEQVRADAWIGLGLTYAAQDKGSDALAAFQKVVEIAPTRPEPYLEMASLYTKMSQPDKAKEVLEKARQVGASDPATILSVGISYYSSKDYARAGDMFRQVSNDATAKRSDQATANALLGKLYLHDGKKADAIAAMKKSLELDPSGSMAEEMRNLIKSAGGK